MACGVTAVHICQTCRLVFHIRPDCYNLLVISRQSSGGFGRCIYGESGFRQ